MPVETKWSLNTFYRLFPHMAINGGTLERHLGHLMEHQGGNKGALFASASFSRAPLWRRKGGIQAFILCPLTAPGRGWA